MHLSVGEIGRSLRGWFVVLPGEVTSLAQIFKAPTVRLETLFRAPVRRTQR